MIRKIALGGILVSIGDAKPNSPAPLPALNGKNPTMSGFSSGAVMTGQFHVSHSSMLDGVGIVAGAPFAMAALFEWGMTYEYTVENIAKIVEHANNISQSGTVDDPANLADDRVYIMHGAVDTTVPPSFGQGVETFYDMTLADAGNLLAVTDHQVGHVWETNKYPSTNGACLEPDYIGNAKCGYDMATEMIRHLYPSLPDVAVSTKQFKHKYRLEKFDQTEFCINGNCTAAHMSDTGFYYRPEACKTQSCKVHMHLHGCEMTHEMIGTKFICRSGLPEVADAYNIIMVFPQTAHVDQGNGMVACWNGGWVALPEASYYTKESIQIQALKAMFDRMLE